MKKVAPVVLILFLLCVTGFGIYRYKTSVKHELRIGFSAQAASCVYSYKEYMKYEPYRNDIERIATEDYNAVFFSTYPIDHFTEYDFNYYRAIYPLKASYCIPDLKTMYDYFNRVSATYNDTEITYLGIRPDIIDAEDLLTLMNEWPDRHYQVIVAYPSLNYWKNLTDEEFEEKFSAYTDFINTLMPMYEENEWMQINVSLYFYGATEWLVGNPANYESDFGVNEGISHSLSMYTDEEHGYMLTPDNYEKELEEFRELVTNCRAESASLDKTQNAKSEYPDLSEWDVVFFGDSVIAFSETSSIPGAFGGLTGAHTYNCGKGGSNATMVNEDSLGVPAVVDAFLSKDLSRFEEGTQIYAGMSDYFDHSENERQKCFVISYGLNDYYSGLPVKNEEDPYDIYTYYGAIHTAVRKLKDAYPDAVIMLMSPNYTSYFGGGMEPQSSVGGLMPDYVAATVSISESEDLPLYNSYTELGINIDNFTEYLLDGTHPNESTRYTMACGLTKLMQDYLERSGR